MLNRRHIIGGAAALPAIVIASGGVAPPAAASALSPDLAALIATAETARAAAEHHDTHVHLPSVQAAAKAVDSIPHTSVMVDGKADYFTTANTAAVSLARDVVRHDPLRQHPDSKALRQLLAADLRRSRAIQHVNTRYDLAMSGERSDDLWTDCGVAESAVAAQPIATAHDLAAKLAFMIDRQMSDGMDWLEELHADARRIAKMEA